MAQVTHANRKGTAADAAKHSTGYAANGESQHTRHAAQPSQAARFDRAPIRTHGRHTLAEQISECERRMEWMEAQLRVTDQKCAREKLHRDIRIKGQFLTRLLIERDGE